MLIIAIDLGKFNSVACLYNTQTQGTTVWGRQFGDNHKVKLGKNRSKTIGVKLSKMASGLWVSLRYFKRKLKLKSLF